jgi:hypothetical protein
MIAQAIIGTFGEKGNGPAGQFPQRTVPELCNGSRQGPKGSPLFDPFQKTFRQRPDLEGGT